MNARLLLIPLGLLASLTYLLDRFYLPPVEPEDDLLLEDGYGFAGIATFVVVVSVLTLLALALVGY